MGRFTGVLGMATMLAWPTSFPPIAKPSSSKTVLWGLGLQLAFGIFVLRVKSGEWLFRNARRRRE